jgi:site-specific recombinase XerD
MFTFADGLADFLVSGQARGLSPKTLDWYRMIGEQFAIFRTSRGADPALSALSVAEARAFVVSLQGAGLSPSSVAGFVRGLRAFSAWCAAEGLVAEDPLRRLPARMCLPGSSGRSDRSNSSDSSRSPRATIG